MNGINLINLLEIVLEKLESKSKSEDIADLLMSLDFKTKAPSKEHDLLIEFSLAASPAEESGVTCMTLDHLKQFLSEYKQENTKL